MKMKLKPCPFCGKEVAEFQTVRENALCALSESEKCPAYQKEEECIYKGIVCNIYNGGCGASTGYEWDEERAIERWNKRVE